MSIDLGNCNVCDNELAVAVAAVPGIPMSLAYGPSCLENGYSYPYWLLVSNTVMIGGMDGAAEWWEVEVRDHLEFFGKTREQFDADVAQEITDFNRSLEQYEEEHRDD